MFTIMKASPTDHHALIDLWLRTNIAAHHFIEKEYWIDQYELVAALLPDAELYVAKQNDTCCGFAGITDDYYVAGLFVDTPYQHQGLGSQLINTCKNDFEELTLNVYTQNKPACNFYFKHGFKNMEESINPDTLKAEYTLLWRK